MACPTLYLTVISKCLVRPNNGTFQQSHFGIVSTKIYQSGNNSVYTEPHVLFFIWMPTVCTWEEMSCQCSLYQFRSILAHVLLTSLNEENQKAVPVHCTIYIFELDSDEKHENNDPQM